MHASPRIRLIAAACTLAGLFLAARLYVVQVVEGREYREAAERQYARPAETVFSRGSIFFTARDGTLVAAAALRSGFTVAIHPKKITDASALLESLRALLPLEEESFLAKARKADDPYEEIARRVDEERARAIAEKNLHGVSVFRERWRFYPGGRLAANALGFVGFAEEALVGRYGLERYYDDVLRRDDDALYQNFFADIFSNLEQAAGERRGSGDIVTAIEPTVAAVLEEALDALVLEWHGERAGGIIMNPENGEIIALSLSPSFDLNAFGQSDPALFGNPLVESVFEMGSILKPLTLAAGLDAKVITATSTYLDEGFLVRNNRRIANFDGKARGRVSMQEVLNQSLNTGAATVALRLGAAAFRGYFARLGLGEETGIDLPSEASGLTANLASGREIELATASYGQGIALTPVQTVRALAALGNGGFLVTPHLARKIQYSLGFSRAVGESARSAVFARETSEEITRMLVRVVDEALLGGAYKLPRHSVAAKTGTALIARSDGAGYYDDRFLHSFFGYFPAYEPRFIIFLYLLEPKGVAFASHTLTEPFMRLATFLINYYEIPPDR